MVKEEQFNEKVERENANPAISAKKRRIKLIVILVCVIFVIGNLATWLISWYTPVSAATPFVYITTRPELNGCGDDLLIGSEWMYFFTPATMDWYIPAWSTVDCVYGLQALTAQAQEGKTVHYEVYTQEERRQTPQKEQVGLYCLHADNTEKRPYVLMIAGGGYSSVCTTVESLPVCASFCEMGYTCFALTYRVSDEYGTEQEHDIIMEDIAAAVSYIEAHSEELNVLTENYLIGGFSAGSVIASDWCASDVDYAAMGVNKPAALCLIYGVRSTRKLDVSLPVFARFCKEDEHFDAYAAEQYFADFSADGGTCNFKLVDCPHGFGLGTGTDADGWTTEAESFWQSVIS